MTTANRWLAASLLGVLALAPAAEAHADQKEECAAAYGATQTFRDEGMLLEAHRQALVCANAACAAFIRAECTQWLADIDTLTPTIIFEALDESGADIPGVRVKVDGLVLEEWLGGKPVPVDPGEHRIRFVIEGAEPNKQLIQVRQGEKNRKVVASFPRKTADPAPLPPKASPPPKQAVPTTEVSPPPEQRVGGPSRDAPDGPPASRKATPNAPAAPEAPAGGGIPTWAWLSGGVGVVALVADAAYAMIAVSSMDEASVGKSTHNADRTVMIALTTVGVMGVVVGALGTIRGVKPSASSPKAISVAPFVSPAGGGVFASVVF